MGTVFQFEGLTVNCSQKIKEMVVSAYKATAEMEWVLAMGLALK